MNVTWQFEHANMHVVIRTQFECVILVVVVTPVGLNALLFHFETGHIEQV